MLSVSLHEGQTRVDLSLRPSRLAAEQTEAAEQPGKKAAKVLSQLCSLECQSHSFVLRQGKAAKEANDGKESKEEKGKDEKEKEAALGEVTSIEQLSVGQLVKGLICISLFSLLTVFVPLVQATSRRRRAKAASSRSTARSWPGRWSKRSPSTSLHPIPFAFAVICSHLFIVFSCRTSSSRASKPSFRLAASSPVLLYFMRFCVRSRSA